MHAAHVDADQIPGEAAQAICPSSSWPRSRSAVGRTTTLDSN